MHGELEKLYENLTTKVLGVELASELVLTALLAEGHVLIQGAPGMGKTSLARIVAESIEAEFRRIQFTPDLLPSEILGFNIYDQGERQFVFHKGPIFGNVILADEINRASPRTQSALLESMNETQVTIDGYTYQLEKPFFVIATENHLSSVGTFPLPDSQLDRFVISFDLQHPGHDTSVEILDIHARGVP
jgi:MoxR-like ATPase